MAAGLLESEGIEAMVMADDASGTFPPLQFIRGVRLMVAAEDEARAKEILAAMAEAGDPSANRKLYSNITQKLSRHPACPTASLPLLGIRYITDVEKSAFLSS